MNANQQIRNMQDLGLCLQGLLDANNQKRRFCEGMLKKFCKSPSCLEAFTEKLKSTDEIERQMAGVLMRIKIKQMWKNVEQNKRIGIRDALLKCLETEKQYLVKKAIVFCIGEVCVYSFKNWKNLNGFLSHCVSNGLKTKNWKQLEIGILLFGVLLEKIPDQLSQNMYKQIIGLFSNIVGMKNITENDRILWCSFDCIHHLTKGVRRLSALGNSGIEVLLISLIPKLLILLQPLIKLEDSQLIGKYFEIFDEVANIRSEKMEFVEIIPKLVDFMLKFVNESSFSVYIRGRASSFVGWVLEFNPSLMIRYNLVGKILNSIKILLCTPEGNELKNIDEEIDEDTCYKKGSVLLDEACLFIPSKYIFRDLLTLSNSLIKTQNNIFSVKAGLTIIGIMAEGCYELTRINLHNLIPLVMKQFHSQCLAIKLASIRALINLFQYCQPEVSDYYDIVFRFLTSIFFSCPSEVIRYNICLAIESFVEHIDQIQFLPYEKQLITNLFKLNSITHDNKVRKQIINALYRCAEVLEDKFAPYSKASMQYIDQVLNSNLEQSIPLKPGCTEFLGIVVKSIGKKNFQQYSGKYISLVFTNIQNNSDDDELMQNSLNCLRTISECLEEGFLPYVEKCLKLAQSAFALPDAYINTKGSALFLASKSNDGNVKQIDLSELGNKQMGLTANEEVIYLKKAAILMVGAIAKSVGLKFLPFFQTWYDVFSNGVCHVFSEDLRKTALVGLAEIGYALFPKNYNPKNVNGQGLTSGVTAKSVELYFDKVYNNFISRIVEDESKKVIGGIFITIGSIADSAGYIGIQKYLPMIAKLMLSVLNQKAKCFLGDDVNINKNEMDHDNLIFDPLVLCLEKLAKLLGPNLDVYFKPMFPILLEYLDHNAFEDISVVAGLFGEISRYFGNKIVSYAPQFLPKLLKIIQTKSYEGILKNCIFCVGNVVYYSPVVLKDNYSNVLKLLYNVVSAHNSGTKVLKEDIMDNIISLLLKMMLNYPLDNNACEMILKIAFSHLPMKVDYDENEYVVYVFTLLIKKKFNLASKYLKNFLFVYVDILAKLYDGTSCTDVEFDITKLTKEIVMVIRQLQNKLGKQVNEILMSFDEEKKRALMQAYSIADK